MNRSKSAISAGYMEEQKAIHPARRRAPHERKAIVIGASPGNIGQAIADHLAGSSMFGEVSCFDKSTLDMTKDSLLSAIPSLSSYDTLVLANGKTWLDWLEDQSDEKISAVIGDSLTASIRAVRDFTKATMETEHRKYIALIGSMAYCNVLNGSSVYCAAKAGIAHFARCAAWELAPKGYNVAAFHPSNTVGTPMTEETINGLMRYRGVTREEAEAYWGAVLPKHEWLKPMDVAMAVGFFVGGAGDYLSGSNINLAGGQR